MFSIMVYINHLYHWLISYYLPYHIYELNQFYPLDENKGA